jgi:hypothetical protein
VTFWFISNDDDDDDDDNDDDYGLWWEKAKAENMRFKFNVVSSQNSA